MEAVTPRPPGPSLAAVGHGVTAGQAVLSRGVGLGVVMKGTPLDGRLLGRNKNGGVTRIMAPSPLGPGVCARTEGGAAGALDLVLHP